MNYLYAAVGTFANVTADIGFLFGQAGSSLYLSLNGNSAWFSYESTSLRTVTILVVLLFIIAVITSASIGAHHAMKTLLAPDNIRHAGIVTFIFPVTVCSDNTVRADLVVKAACVAFYMILYSLVGGLIVVPVVACGMVMFAFNALYIVGRRIIEAIGNPGYQPFPITTAPLIGTVFALLNLMYTSALSQKRRIGAPAPSQ